MIIEIGDHKININPLTRGQIKNLRREGIKLEALGDLDLEQQEDLLERIFSYSCPDEDTDALTVVEGYELFGEIVALTYSDDDLKKKYESLQRYSSRGKRSTAKSAKKRASRHKGTARK